MNESRARDAKGLVLFAVVGMEEAQKNRSKAEPNAARSSAPNINMCIILIIKAC